MEKSRDIPGWYQKLLSLRTKPASQITLKQYSLENENRMKIIYPFLPLDQIKGKLHAQWKKQQVPDNRTPSKTEARQQKKYMHPVVQILPRHKTNIEACLTDKSQLPVNWMNGSDCFKAWGKNEKTFRGRSFVFSPKVPEVISQSSTLERSILKTGRSDADCYKEKRQPASRVSFHAYEEGNPSPLLYSPPSPFVLSPLSDAEQTEEKGKSSNHQSEQKAAGKSANVLNKKVKQGKRAHQTSGKSASKTTAAPGKSQSTREISSQKKDGHSEGLPLCKKYLLGSAIDQNQIGKGKNGKRSKTYPRQTPYNASELKLPSSQKLEPPKFGTPAEGSPNQEEKRFCLFEDEFVVPKPQKDRSENGIKRTPHTRSKRPKSYTWSPALPFSQQTPKLKKSKHTIFSQDKPETYHKDKRNKSGAVEKKQDPLAGRRKSPRFNDTGEMKSLARRESPKTAGTRKKQAGKQHSKTVGHQLVVVEAVSLNTEMEDKTSHTQDVQKPYGREGGSNQYKSNPKQPDSLEKHKMQSTHNRSKADTLQVEQIHARSRSRCYEENDQNPSLKGIGKHTCTEHGDHQKENNRNDQIESTSNETRSPAIIQNKRIRVQVEKKTVLNRKDSPQHGQLQSMGKVTALENSPQASNQLSSQLSSRRFLFETSGDEISYSPDTSEGTNILRHILFQLKGTAASSQGQSYPPSSPAQSRLTEVSDMSRSPLNCAPSPTCQKDLMDCLEPEVTDETSFATTLVNKGSLYRKQDNVLCNMFDAPDSPHTAVPAKVKRNLPSETCPEVTDFSMLFSGDAFV